MRLAKAVCFAITACGMAVGSVWADGLSDNTSRMSSSMSASSPDVMYYSPSSGVVLYDSDVDARMASNQSCKDVSLGSDCGQPAASYASSAISDSSSANPRGGNPNPRGG